MATVNYGIDFGTNNVKLVTGGDQPRIYTQKNTVALIGRDHLYAYGDEAFAMYEKSPEHIDVVFPVTGGLIAEFGYLQTFIFDFIEKNFTGKTKGAEFYVAVPTDITEVQKKAFFDLFYKSKARPKLVMLADKPIADAIGLGLDVNEPTGIMIVDMGADTTEISVLSLGGLVKSQLLRYGGNKFDEDIVRYIRNEELLYIGQKTAASLKEAIGWALPNHADRMVVVGRNVSTGLPIEYEINSEMIYNAIAQDLEAICSNIKTVLEHTPPEIARDIIHNGIYLTGGSCMLRGLPELVAGITGIKVNTCEEPALCVAKGLHIIANDKRFNHLAYNLNERMYG